MTSKKTILGIETSCDDTSICVLSGDPSDLSLKPDILGLSYFSQEEILKKWGGVVPEVAARNHLLKLTPLIEQALEQSSLKSNDIDAIAVTVKPGLLGPLLTGLNAAKTLALYHETPLVPVNHLHAHIEAIHIDQDISYPYLGLIVSGGHTLFMLVKSPYDFTILGTTIDDAAGEAFDKGGKLLGLPYPAGRFIDELAKNGDESKFLFPIGLKKSSNSDLSYSGVKTSLRQFIEKNPDVLKDKQMLADTCASYQRAIVDAIKLKARYALKKAQDLSGKFDIDFVVGGGVAANSKLRSTLSHSYKNVSFVTPNFCTDNGAMIANLGLRTFKNDHVDFPACLELDARGRVIPKEKLHQQSRYAKVKARNEN